MKDCMTLCGSHPTLEYCMYQWANRDWPDKQDLTKRIPGSFHMTLACSRDDQGNGIGPFNGTWRLLPVGWDQWDEISEDEWLRYFRESVDGDTGKVWSNFDTSKGIDGVMLQLAMQVGGEGNNHGVLPVEYYGFKPLITYIKYCGDSDFANLLKTTFDDLPIRPELGTYAYYKKGLHDEAWDIIKCTDRGYAEGELCQPEP